MKNFLGMMTAAAIIVFTGTALLVPTFAYAAPPQTLFFDGFESDEFYSDTFVNWTSAGENWLVTPGSIIEDKGARVTNDSAQNDALVKAVSTRGYESVVFSYWFKATELESSDAVYAEYSTDGGATWSRVYAITLAEADHIDGTDIGLYNKVHPLPASAANNPNFRIRFDAKLFGGAWDGVWVDDVMVSGEPMGNTVPPPPPPPPSGGNLIANPSVESGFGPLPANWKRGQWGTNQTTFSYPVSGIDGARAIAVTMTSHSSGDAKWYFDDVNVTPGTTYTYEESYKASVPTELILRYTQSDGSFSYAWLASLSPSSTWTETTRSFTAPAGVAAVTIFHLIASPGELTTDAFSLTTP